MNAERKIDVKPTISPEQLVRMLTSRARPSIGTVIRGWFGRRGPDPIVHLPRTYEEYRNTVYTQLEPARQTLQRRLNPIDAITPKISISKALELSTEQLESEDGVPARNDELLAVYRDIRSELESLNAQRPVHRCTESCQHAALHELTLHHANLMEVASLNQRPHDQASLLWIIYLQRHALDLRRVGKLVRLGLPIADYYKRPEELTGFFSYKDKVVQQ